MKYKEKNKDKRTKISKDSQKIKSVNGMGMKKKKQKTLEIFLERNHPKSKGKKRNIIKKNEMSKKWKW